MRWCSVCASREPRYRCPTCRKPYCTATCFQSHDVDCYEKFAKSNVISALKRTKVNEKQAQAFANTFWKTSARHESTHNQNKHGSNAQGQCGETQGQSSDTQSQDSGEESSTDEQAQDPTKSEIAAVLTAEQLDTLLSGINLDQVPDIDESILTGAQRAHFRRLVADGSLAAPFVRTGHWWEEMRTHSVVPCSTGGWDFVDDECAEFADDIGAPRVQSTLTNISSLTKKRPPDALRFNLLDQLLSYVYVCRLYAGNPLDDALAAAEALMTLSPTLSGDVPTTHSSAAEALHRFWVRSFNVHLVNSSAFSAACIADVKTILNDPGFVALSLAGAHHIAFISYTSESHKGSCTRSAIKSVIRAKRKLHFMMSWWRSIPPNDRRAVGEILRFHIEKDVQRRAEFDAESCREKSLDISSVLEDTESFL